MSLTDRIDGLVDEGIQSHERGLDLTAAEIHEIDEPGRVDFGGDELAEAGLSTHERTLRNPGDEYGWWYLGPGGYLLEYNETLTAGEPLTLQTRDAVRARGAFHPTVAVETIGRMPLWVGGSGIRLKENARVSTLFADGR